MGAYKSPGKTHEFDFIFEGEIRFGPIYYRLKLDGDLISNRIFGFEFKWHPESEYLALQEWLTADFQKGPITALTLVDLTTRKFARVSKADQGYIKPLMFKDELIIFKKEYPSGGKTIEYEINIKQIQNWVKE